MKESEIIPIQYDSKSPFKYNNFVYHIKLHSPLSIPECEQPHQTGTDVVPEGTREFILRLTNPDAEGMNPETRVENEVAIISLAATALNEHERPLVPKVYAWGSAASPFSQGWVIQEMMPGLPVDENFESMSFEVKKVILAQMAKILKTLQAYKLPSSIRNHGGVTFDDTGRIISAAMTSVGSGPWPTYEDYYIDRLKRALQEADENQYIKGWNDNGVRVRLEKFIEKGVSDEFDLLESKDEKVIVHADFSELRLNKCNY